MQNKMHLPEFQKRPWPPVHQRPKNILGVKLLRKNDHIHPPKQAQSRRNQRNVWNVQNFTVIPQVMVTQVLLPLVLLPHLRVKIPLWRHLKIETLVRRLLKTHKRFSRGWVNPPGKTFYKKHLFYKFYKKFFHAELQPKQLDDFVKKYLNKKDNF